MQPSPTTTRVFRFTRPYLTSSARAVDLRRDWFPLEVRSDYTISVLDFSGMTVVNPAALRELVLPVARGIRGGQYGAMTLFVSAPMGESPGVRDWVQDVARAQDLAVYVTSSLESISDAWPAGELSATERQTIVSLRALGGKATAADLARHVGIEASAATNRLTSLWRAGYLYRITQSRREGDLFVDPSQIDGDLEIILGDPDAEHASMAPVAN